MPDPDDQPAVSGRKIADVLSAEARLCLVLRAFAAAPLGAGTPQLLISQAVAATTVAVRGEPLSTEISPKKSPSPSRRTRT